MAIEQDWRNNSKYYLSPEQANTVEMRSIAWYGTDMMTTICMEECAELIQAISKLKRYNPEDPDNKVSRKELIENLYEEMADVQINLLFEIYDLKPSDLRRMIDHKVWRMKQKMEAQGAKV